MTQIKNVFNFLKNYNELLNPIITDINRQIWSYRILDAPIIDELWSIYQTEDLEQLKILEINRPELKSCPSPDEIIIEWLRGNWRSLDIYDIKYEEKKIFNRIEVKNNKEEIVEIEECFIDDKARLNSYEKWNMERKKWLNTERPKRNGLNLYNSLFRLYSDIKRESESVELILGDGIITWNTLERTINHPVLLQRVNLKFNPDKPSFIIACDELETELYTSMLRAIPSINQSLLPEIIEEGEHDIYHIADKENNIGFYKRLINIVDEKGKYIEKHENNNDTPRIMHNPILFLRKRTLGYSIFIDSIIEHIQDNGGTDIPDFFNTMVGNYREDKTKDDSLQIWNEDGIDKDVLLTLPANKEQLKIIKYLDDYGEVLVQGPPGTGKTHTIANLIGHLLSEGKNVLVTSHTEKALTVLKDKVYGDLQGLCISVLSESSQKKEMDATLFEIAEKSTIVDTFQSKKKIGELESKREKLINKYQEKNQELIEIRSLNYKDVVLDNETISPINAAKFINEGKDKYDYIPGISRDDTVGIPISDEQLEKLYKSNSLVTIIEEKVLSNDLPNLEDIWETEDFNIKVDRYFKYNDILKEKRSNLTFSKEIDIQTLENLLHEVKIIKEELNKLKGFQYAILSRNIQDVVYIEFWQIIFGEYNEMMSDYEDYRKLTFDNEYDIPEEIQTEDTLETLKDIINSNKEIPVNLFNSILNPKWKTLRDLIRNNGKVIEKIQDYKNIYMIMSYEIKRRKLVSRINKLMKDTIKGFELDEKGFEIGSEIFIKKVKIALNWYKDNWTIYVNKAKEYIEVIDTYDELYYRNTEDPVKSIKETIDNCFITNMEEKINSILLEELEDDFNKYEEQLHKCNKCGKYFQNLIETVKEKNKERYSVIYLEIKELYNKKEVHLLRNYLLDKIESIAPEWKNVIKKRKGIHGNNIVPENIHLAWRWYQLNNQINRINSYDLNTIQKELEKINKLLIKNARELAYEKSWYYKIKNITDQQTQAIEGWRQTMKQLGKGTGKRAPMLLKKARELMPLCQTAIPVWIMSLNKVAENFQPGENKFDVIIIDEASQANILALSALYLGKKIIIVGDDEQVSPSSIGIKANEMNALIEQYLGDIPNNHLFNGQTSVYDMAKTTGFKSLMLTEHFRCLPEIIEFSNALSYNHKIKPLRDDSNVSVKPAVVNYRVTNAYRDSNKTNQVEAEHIASLICTCIEMDEYKDKTIGVISLLGEKQAYEIDKILQMKLEPKEYENRRIQCGTSAQFQGDERDIMFLSVVESPNENGGPVRLVSEGGRNDMYRKSYNVAASRAKEQMWIVYSLNPEIDLKPEDLRLKLIRHAINPLSLVYETKLDKTESDFEIKVMRALLDKGYKVYPQWKVGAYRIDMVVEDKDKRIAIECDGERWHTMDSLADDMKRQAILERLGWRFIRVRGSVFYKDPEETLGWLFQELYGYEIKPNYLNQEEKEDDNKNIDNTLIDEIKRKANEIRIEWNEEFDETEKIQNVEESTLEKSENKDEVVKKDITEGFSLKEEDKEFEEKVEEKFIKNKEVKEKKKVRVNNIKNETKKNSEKPLFDFRKR